MHKTVAQIQDEIDRAYEEYRRRSDAWMAGFTAELERSGDSTAALDHPTTQRLLGECVAARIALQKAWLAHGRALREEE